MRVYLGGRPLEEADPAGRPVGEERVADYPRARHRSPEPAVVRLSTIVAHHVVLAAGNRDRAGEIARAHAVAGIDVGILLPYPVAVDVALDQPDPITREPHHPLDECLRGLLLLRHATWLGRVLARLVLALRGICTTLVVVLGRVKDHDVADARRREVRADPVDEDPLVDVQSRKHRAARYPIRLDDEGLDRERQAKRGSSDQDELER